ncbi:MAG: class I SAM-dependent methyltransferase [Magnetococcus sp. DMHC-8]
MASSANTLAGLLAEIERHDLSYYATVNGGLLNQIPVTARRILDIGCGVGALGYMAKQRHPDVYYCGVELHPEAARVAGTHLDEAHCANIESADLPLAKGFFDCIVFGDVLEHLYHPLETLRRLKENLTADGCVVCCIPNIQHISFIESLLCGDFQYQDAGLLDRTHIRFFTYASFIKLLLDAGLVPKIVSQIALPDANAGLLAALQGAAGYLQQDGQRFARALSTFQYIFHGTHYAPRAGVLPPPFPISFVVPTNNERILKEYLLSSPVLQGQHPHQLILLKEQRSMAEALVQGVGQAVHDFVVVVHQDVYLPAQWDALFCRQVLQAEATRDDIGLFGVYGASNHAGQIVPRGSLVDRQDARLHGEACPVPVGSVDDCLIGFRKARRPEPDPACGFYLYGTDLLCAGLAQGRVAVVVEALCYHNPGLGAGGPPPAWQVSARHLATKWPHYLPAGVLTVLDTCLV